MKKRIYLSFLASAILCAPYRPTQAEGLTESFVTSVVAVGDWASSLMKRASSAVGSAYLSLSGVPIRATISGASDSSATGVTASTGHPSLPSAPSYERIGTVGYAASPYERIGTVGYAYRSGYERIGTVGFVEPAEVRPQRMSKVRRAFGEGRDALSAPVMPVRLP
ncbi:MAG: hypothetical protein HYT79_06975 [Elusimicrobia bacterium]|nr:hypothetical protein [Elusimicrobiota bacterium]